MCKSEDNWDVSVLKAMLVPRIKCGCLGLAAGHLLAIHVIGLFIWIDIVGFELMTSHMLGNRLYH